MKALTQELVEAGAIEIPEEELGNVSGGVQAGFFTEGIKYEFDENKRREQEIIDSRKNPKPKFLYL